MSKNAGAIKNNRIGTYADALKSGTERTDLKRKTNRRMNKAMMKMSRINCKSRNMSIVEFIFL